MLQIVSLVLLALALTLSQSAYAASTTTEPNTNENNQQQQQQQQSEPQQESQTPESTTTKPEAKQETTTPATQTQAEEPKELPKCDGSFQDCVTRNGDTCKAGEGGEKCECAPDNSDCQKNPNVVNNPVIPAIKQVVDSGPDGDCLFHPELPKCKSDNGVCPEGFAQNEDGNCFPRHDKCPKGFHSHEDDETGRCIPDSVPCEPGFVRDPDFPTCSSKASVCRDHPELKLCGGDGHDHDKHGKKVIVVHRTINHNNLSNECFFEIKTAWLNKISRGESSRVDNIIDKCLGIPH
jgi:hypothetical protein